jgi:hypothetical protein
MTATDTPSASPLCFPQWEALEWEHETGKVVRYRISIQKDFDLEVVKRMESNPWMAGLLHLDDGYWTWSCQLPDATTAEEAIAEAVVALCKFLAGFSENLGRIPLTLPSTLPTP